ncbi:MAG: alpha/beta hydrolase [Pseudomonadota bacterium]
MKRFIPGLVLALLATGAWAQTPYNAETTYRKLVRDYPFIRIAGSETPASVQLRKDLVYLQHPGLALGLDLYLPQPGPTPAPLVILVHGGGWASGDRTGMAPLAARLAARGFAAATVSYRLSGQARYPAAVTDVRESLRWLRDNAAGFGIDPGRVAISGASAGGQIASLVGMLEPQAVGAVINIDGLSDFTTEESRKHEDDPNKKPSAAGAWFGGRYAEKAPLWRAASPITHVGKDSPPVLFIISGVPRFSVGREAMAAKLASYGIASDTVALPGTPHSFWLFDPWVEPTVEAMDAFLRRTLP